MLGDKSPSLQFLKLKTNESCELQASRDPHGEVETILNSPPSADRDRNQYI